MQLIRRHGLVFCLSPFISKKAKYLINQVLITTFGIPEKISVVFYMKKNNKFRNNNYNNQIFSLNYRFDSTSPAGKCSGTALDLIKRYNELAKEAQGNGNLVEAEVFRQYAEHYRKIVTEVNERKNQQQPRQIRNSDDESQETAETPAEGKDKTAEDNTEVAAAAPVKREFKVIEITSAEPAKEEMPQNEDKPKPGRPRGRRKAENAAVL